jgi:aminoglycoside 3-N-acetyltransferase
MRSGRATQTMMKQGAAVLVNGQREWVEYDSPMYDSDDFDALGEAFEQQYTNEVKQARIGQAVCRLVRVQPLIDFGVQWMQSRSTT